MQLLPIGAVRDRVRAMWAPPPDLTVSQFADQEIVVASGPLAGTRWQTDFAPYQRGILDAVHEPGAQFVVVMGSSQWGKALALDTPIPTPCGWTTMAAISAGDRVFDESGQPCRVLLATDVMPDRACYRVLFSDGSALVADAEHQWFVESDTYLPRGEGRQRWPHTGVLTTQKIAGTYLWHASKGAKPRHRYAVPVAKPLTLPDVDLLVPPYVLGAWLGDGNTCGGRIYSDDRGVVDEIAHCGQVVVANGQRFSFGLPGLIGKLRDIAVLGNKHIPRAYLRSSERQRWELLAGLMDTDGSVEPNTRCEFSTTIAALADGMVELLCSLGLKPTVKEIRPTVMYRGARSDGAPAWRIRFIGYDDQPIFKLARKQARLRPRAGRRTTETCRRRIVSVEAVDSVPVKCIAVDSPSRLYLAGRTMIPTHNTACAVNIVAYHIAHDPCEILVVEPTVDPMAKDFAKNRLEPTIKASPRLNAVVDKKRQRDASNTTLLKTFRGGFLALAGSNSASSLAARAVRLLVLDEVDRYERQLKGEGDTISIAIKRTTTFRSRRRIVMLSSPTLVGAPIHAWFERGDQRRYHVPCPSCGVMHPFMWKQVKWDGDDPATARLICPGCEYKIDEAERVAILGRGEWRAQNAAPERGVISFHLWEAYSPLSSLADIVTGFLRARDAQKAGDAAGMHTWQNTTLGEPVEPEKGDGVEPHGLLIRREPFGHEIPVGGCVLTAGADVQDDRLEVLILGWGPGEESWLVDRHTLPGDTSQPEPWAMLDELLEREYLHASGVKLPISATCMDSGGHRTTMVYDYASRQAAKRVYAIIGRDGQRPIVSSPSPRRWGRQQRQVPLYTVGVDAAKAILVSRLKLPQDTSRAQQPGFIHLPALDWCDEELVAQLTSERLVTTFHRGVPKTEWRKMRPRNEALDMFVYGLAALRLLNANLEALSARLAHRAEPAAPAPAPKRSSWLGPRRDGWLRR